MEGHNLKAGDLARQLPHVVHSLLPRVDDPVVQEEYRRTGLVLPAQIHGKWFHLLEQNPSGESYFMSHNLKIWLYLQF